MERVVGYGEEGEEGKNALSHDDDLFITGRWHNFAVVVHSNIPVEGPELH